MPIEIYKKRINKIIKQCLICKKEFFIWFYQKNTAKFCSQKCHYKFMKGKSTWMKGKHHSKLTKEKMSLKRKGKKLSEKTKKKISKINKGHLVSQETRKKIGLKNKGKKRTLEQRINISNAHKGIHKGKNNPSYLHGMCHDNFYGVWNSMIQRCNNCNQNNYYLYGGRGIKVCKRWLDNFINFRDDMYENYLKHIEKFGKKKYFNR